jgi:hypothetical protein
MYSVKVIGLVLALLSLAWAASAGPHRGELAIQERVRATGETYRPFAAKGDTIFHTSFEAGQPLGVNVDYNAKSQRAKASPDMWHLTTSMLYHGTTTWMVAPVDSYFCHIGCDTNGYSDGNEVGYQIQFDLTGYGDAELFYLSAMQAYENATFDKFVVWGQHEEMGDNWLNLDPGEGYAWGGDWGAYWYEPDEGVLDLSGLAGHPEVIIEFWFLSESGHPEGFGVAIDEIIVTGTPATAVEDHEQSSSVPQEHVLHQPYPNPFNAQANIRYQLIEPGEIRLNIYNLRGQLVTTLAHGPQSEGEHITSWDGRDEGGHMVESGIYFCRLQVGDLAQVRKLMLLK